MIYKYIESAGGVSQEVYEDPPIAGRGSLIKALLHQNCSIPSSCPASSLGKTTKTDTKYNCVALIMIFEYPVSARGGSHSSQDRG